MYSLVFLCIDVQSASFSCAPPVLFDIILEPVDGLSSVELSGFCEHRHTGDN